MIDNYAIADQFSLLAKLMDIHGDNPFKSKSYSSAAFVIEQLKTPLAGMPADNILKVKGLGESTGKKVLEILKSGQLNALQELLAETPEGVLEMMQVKGLGPKKINTLWKDLQIETIPQLEAACRQNKIAKVKGFGEKTEAKILESLSFIQSNKGYWLYKDLEESVHRMQQKMEAKFPQYKHEITGDFRRQMEAVKELEWVTTATKNEIISYLLIGEMKLVYESDDLLIICAEDGINLKFHFSSPELFAKKLMQTTGSIDFISAFEESHSYGNALNETSIFEGAGLTFIPPYLRESADVLQEIKTNKDVASIVQTGSIKGLIHAHSNWSDGSYSIEQMADELIRTGFEYLVLSDHSKSAGYAGGLSEARILEQHAQIDQLNKKLAPFKIFKSIECDILGDGSLDYSNEVLSAFDLVITSIHSNLDMDEDKAMMRLMGAITHPYTTILGHMTGRLLLRRKGYPIDHKKIIEACIEHKVVIEINASPYRLDMDWRWVNYAVEKGALLSINPDAHVLEEFTYIKYGTLVAQKGGLPTKQNLSSYSLIQFEEWLKQTKEKKGID